MGGLTAGTIRMSNARRAPTALTIVPAILGTAATEGTRAGVSGISCLLIRSCADGSVKTINSRGSQVSERLSAPPYALRKGLPMCQRAHGHFLTQTVMTPVMFRKVLL